MKKRLVLFSAILLIGGGLAGSEAYSEYCAQRQNLVRQELSELHFPRYSEQKVVYHITGNGGWFGHDYTQALGSIANHLNAVDDGRIDLRVVMQGEGVGLLRQASGNPKLSSAIDSLRKRGVKFEVCRNSLISLSVDPRELYGLKNEDIVAAAVAELAELQGKGFVYLKL